MTKQDDLPNYTERDVCKHQYAILWWKLGVERPFDDEYATCKFCGHKISYRLWKLMEDLHA